MRIEIISPDGIGEIGPGSNIAGEIVAALAPDRLRDGDIVVIASKILSKHAARRTTNYAVALAAETAEIVASRPGVRIVRNRLGIVQAGAGIDRSNVAEDILLLPIDPDHDAAKLRAELQACSGARLGVIISDTAGRPWRIGQTDHAIGLSGVLAVDDHAGRVDRYGNELTVTAIAIADELAAAADLAKTKLGHRPVAVVRGRGDLVGDHVQTSRNLQRPPASDMFAKGSREAVLAAALGAVGAQHAYPEVVLLAPEAATEWILNRADPAERAVLARILAADHE